MDSAECRIRYDWTAAALSLYAVRSQVGTHSGRYQGPDMGRAEGNTTGGRLTLHDLSGLSSRDRSKLGPRGESNAQPIESMPLGALGGCFDGWRHDLGAPPVGLGRGGLLDGNVQGLNRKPDGSLAILQNILWARDDLAITLARPMEKGSAE